MTVSEWIAYVDQRVWGPGMLVLLMGTGVFLTLRTRFLPWRNLGWALKSVLGRDSRAKAGGAGDVSPFSALMTTLAATIGTGNIVGVATAIVSGGPGAIFWMWVMALLGMMTSYAENVLGIYYRRKDPAGGWRGGPMYYLRDGLGGKPGRVLAVLFAVSLFWGSVALTPQAVLAALTGRGQDALSVGIITQLRLPRAVMAALLGAALSAAGYLLQTFFANPIAGPFVMGISSGAKLAVALVMVLFLNYGLLTSSAVLILAAFAGAMAAMAFVLAAARRVQRMSILVICGVMIGYICSAITEFVVAFAQDSSIVNLHNWSQGSFSGMTWSNVRTAALVVLPALAAAFCLAKPMAAYQMGEAYARSVGVDVRRFSRLLVLLSSLLAACVTAFAGPISFVGIAVPHLVKQLFGSARPLVVLPGCCLGGAAFCLLCDLIARSMFAPTELSISAVTAVFGAPVVIWLLVRRGQEGVR